MILECKQRLHVVNATFDMVLNAADDLEAYTEQMLTEVYDHDADGLVSSSELGDLDGGSFVTLDESLWLARVSKFTLFRDPHDSYVSVCTNCSTNQHFLFEHIRHFCF